jgi:hypothetical protein
VASPGKKKGGDNFIASVRESISRTNVTRLRVQKFSKKARQYSLILGLHMHLTAKNSRRKNTNKQSEINLKSY